MKAIKPKKKKTVTVISNCYNEIGNVEKLHERVAAVFAGLGQYAWELLFIDNCSTDGTRDVLRRLAAREPRVKVILNARNFGAERSGFHGLMQCRGDAVILMSSDLQDPPELIPEFLKHWEAGVPIVTAVKNKSRENPLLYGLRHAYYRLMRMVGEGEHIDHFTGFGLYDQSVIEALRGYRDPIPYFRGMITELGLPRATVPFTQPKRASGKTSQNFFRLFDVAMLGLVSHSRLPLRLAVFIGLGSGVASALVALFYLAYKLVFWDRFLVGQAPLVIGLFFFSSVQLFFIGMIGEYIGAIHTQVRQRPLVVEEERINFGPRGARR